jgi:hypothetical protein
MPTNDQIACKVESSILLNIGAGLVSSIVVYVSISKTDEIIANWHFLASLIVAAGLIFEWGRA